MFKDESAQYIAELLQGDGHISLPYLANTILNRILNPRTVFTSHVKDITLLYKKIPKNLGGNRSFSN